MFDTSYLVQLLFWLIFTAAMWLAAHESHDPSIQLLGWLMVMEWSFTNIVLAVLGRNWEPVVTPWIDFAIAVLVTYVGWKRKSLLASVVLLLFALLGGVYVVSWLGRIETDKAYLIAKNTIYALQWAFIGGAGGLAILDRTVQRGKRAGWHLSLH